MQPPQKRLGRGLRSLISVSEEGSDALPSPPPAAGQVEVAEPSLPMVPVEQIRPNPFQPRRDIPPDQLKSLAESLRKNGILQPVSLRKKGDQLYELIAGERRWRAAQLAGMKAIPAVVRAADDREMLELALVENIFREDLNAMDRAGAYKRYCDEFGLSPEEIGERLGEDRTTIANYLRLLDLPSEVKQWVAEGRLGMGHARCLLGLRSAGEITQLAKQVMEQDLSVRAIEQLVRERLSARVQARRPAEPEGDTKRVQVRNLEQAFSRALETKVEIHEAARKGKGRIVIHYFSLDDFDRVLERLGVDRDGT